MKLITFALCLLTLVLLTSGQAQRRPTRAPARVTVHTACPASETAKVRPVWSGKDGWLFGRPDLITRLELPASTPFYLSRLAAALRSKGVTPVALIVPTRASVVYRELGENPALAAYDPAAAARGYRHFLAQLRAAGFIAPDLLGVARKEGDAFFFKRDHHWRPAAARAAAQAVAAQLKTQLGALPKTQFTTHRRPPKKQLGTLQRRVSARCPGFRLPREPVAQFETDSKVAAASLQAALFSRLPTEVALVGTSNSQRGAGKPALNFDGFLREALGLEVLNVAFPGGGVYGSLQAYLLSDEFRRDPPTVLLWETLYMSWQSRAGLVAEARQVIPSVYGTCRQPVARRRLKTLQPGKTVLLGALRTPSQGAYLHLEMDDPALVKFGLELRYRGAAEQVHITRTTRVVNTGEFYLELSDTVTTPLEAVILDLPKPTSGGAKISLCRS